MSKRSLPAKDITPVIVTLQERLAVAHEAFHAKLEGKEKHLSQIDAVICILASLREFHRAIGSNPEHAAMLTTIRAEFEDIRREIPSRLLQVKTSKKPKVSHTLYQSLVAASAAVTKLLDAGMGLEIACRHVINKLASNGTKLSFSESQIKSAQEDWKRLKSWRNNFVSGRRDVSDKKEEQFYSSYEKLINKDTAGYPAQEAADMILNTIPRLMA